MAEAARAQVEAETTQTEAAVRVIQIMAQVAESVAREIGEGSGAARL